MNRFWIIALGLILLGQWAWAAKLKVGEAFPTGEVSYLTKPGKMTLGSLKGHVVLVDFWASWCGPCKQELPALEKLKDVKVVAISVDEDKSAALDFVKAMPLKLELYYDEGGKLSDQIGIEVVPSSFILDKKGVVRFIHSSFAPGEEAQMMKEIKSLQ